MMHPLKCQCLPCVMRSTANAINSDLCILTSMVWILRYATLEVTDEQLAVFDAAAGRLSFHAGGLLFAASKHSVGTGETDARLP